MIKDKLRSSLEKKDSLIKGSFKIFTKSCISKCNFKTLAKLSKESVKSCLNLITIKKMTDNKMKVNWIFYLFSLNFFILRNQKLVIKINIKTMEARRLVFRRF